MKVLTHDNGNGAIDFEIVFRQLNAELIKIDATLELVCAGGYVLQLHGYRATADIDAFFINNKMTEDAIRKVGDEFNINKADELWLNNSISNLNPKPPAEYLETVHQFSNLIVKAVDIRYLIGMKLVSAREQDLKDVAEILKRDKNKLPLELLSKLGNMGFEIDISVLLDGFEKAYGIQWLEEFYKNNEAELRNYY
ncbi:MAG: DUF6036 family nucleotidyltransferase [Oscillospiraceae bacterium]|nr:DUF6036 family nucleotidyltransferase [Oscillospiraceae bacterium]